MQYNLPPRSNEVLQEILYTSENVVDTFLDKQYKILIKLAKTELLSFYDTLERDSNGRITEKGSTEWVTKIAILENKLISILQGVDYNVGINNYLSDYDKIKQLNYELHTKLNGIVDFDKLEESLTQKERFIASKVLYELKQGGIKLNFVEPTKRVLISAITLGSSITDAKKQIAELYKLNGETNNNRLKSYIGQVARDAVYSYNGAINQTIADGYGLTKYAYLGGVVADSRPFCTKYHGTEIDKKDLSNILTTYLSSPNLSAGMFAVNATDYENNFLTYRGGWNCRHIAIPIN